jgi:hypothetical protein
MLAEVSERRWIFVAHTVGRGLARLAGIAVDALVRHRGAAGCSDLLRAGDAAEFQRRMPEPVEARPKPSAGRRRDPVDAGGAAGHRDAVSAPAFACEAAQRGALMRAE